MITEEIMLSSGENIQSCSLKSRLIVLRVLRRTFTAAVPTASMTQSPEVVENHPEEKMVPREKDQERKVVAVTNHAHLGVAHQVRGQEGERTTPNTRQKLLRGRFPDRQERT